MKNYFIFIFVCFIAYSFSASFKPENERAVLSTDSDSTVLAKIYAEGYSSWGAYNSLQGLCIKAPKRLSGSAGAQVAVEYMQQVMKTCQFDKVWLQPVMVPHWERGSPELGQIIYDNGNKNLVVNICALGGSLGTDKDGLTAEIIELNNFDELEKLGKKGISGKIVFFNHRWDDRKTSTFSCYGETVAYRYKGPAAAEKLGAVGCIVRSCTSAIDTFPHTGTMRNDSAAAKIPSVAIATKDAELLSTILQKEKGIKFFIKMNSRWFPDTKSYNVIGEIRGSEHPEKIIVVGGHLDAWDLSEGAHDDGAGVTGSVEAVRIFKALRIRPKHTIRCVCWMNEENGGRGGRAYADSSALKQEKHIAAIESDAGGFTPRGFGLDMAISQKKKIQSWTNLFFQYGIYDFTNTGGGADISPLKASGTPQIGLMPDGSRYFDYHHTEDDVFKNVNRRELQAGAASMAAMIYLIDKYGL
jgi:carboxypeptidase Q